MYLDTGLARAFRVPKYLVVKGKVSFASRSSFILLRECKKRAMHPRKTLDKRFLSNDASTNG